MTGADAGPEAGHDPNHPSALDVLNRPPYSADERRVASYMAEIMPDIGAGPDPIGFLIASHRVLRQQMIERTKAETSSGEDCQR